MLSTLEEIDRVLMCDQVFDEDFLLDSLQAVYHKIQDMEISSLATSIICRIAALNYKSELVKEILHECIVASRIFIYDDMLQKECVVRQDVFSGLARDYYSQKSGITLTIYQKNILSAFRKYKRIVVSAPTSFGKSTIVPELIDSADNNICIVVPTLSLLSEYVSRFIQDVRFYRYNIVYTSSQELKSKNIFIVTPERMDIILDQNPGLQVDFFVMDEVYKISNKDDRSLIFANCLYRLAKTVSKFYLIGPYYNGFSPNFLKRFDAQFLQFDVEIVAKNKVDISQVSPGEDYSVKGKRIKKVEDKYKNLTRLVDSLDGQTLVYVAKTRTAEIAAKHISSNFSESSACDGLIDFISTAVGREWSLGIYLKKGVAFHHALMPKYVQREIVHNFNAGLIKVLVCTATLIEGVNTSAQNVIVFDNTKGKYALTGFDVKNIEGRSGRLGKHFIGENYSLAEIPIKSNVENIDFIFFDSTAVFNEANLLIDKSDLNEALKRQRKKIEQKCNDCGVEVSLLKGNKYIDILKQLELIKFLRSHPSVMREMYFDGTLPDKETFGIWLDFSYNYLISDSQKSEKDLPQYVVVGKANYYVYKNPSIHEFINSWNKGSFDARVRKTFKLITRMFEFSLPKSLLALANIYNYINKSSVDMSHVVSLLEHGLRKRHEILLKEAGIPPIIIRKISRFFDETYSIRDIQMSLKGADLKHLTEYEKKILHRTLSGQK